MDGGDWFWNLIVRWMVEILDLQTEGEIYKTCDDLYNFGSFRL